MEQPIDTEYGNLIEYFVYDLNFGKDWEPEMIVDKNGEDIDFSTAEKVYEYLSNPEN